MTNYSSKILNNSVSGLTANQAALATIGNNIANVNTPGYTRRTAVLETRPGQRSAGTGVDVGSGVQVADVSRASDQYLEALLRDSIGSKAQDELKNDYIARIDDLFDLSGTTPTIGSALNSFFDSINQLSLNPSSIELRANVIQRGNDLTSTIQLTYNTIASTQDELDRRLTSEIDNVNSLASQIAELNGTISQREAAGGLAADQRDQRDNLLNKLSEKIGFNVVEDSNGMVNLTLDNGFPIVGGTNARTLSLTGNPTFATGTVPPSLSGGVLRYIVYDYGGSEFDLTNSLKNSSGTIAGILQLRGTNSNINATSPFVADGALVAVASRVEAFTRQLLTEVNHQYLGKDANGIEIDEAPATTLFEPSAVDLNGNPAGGFLNPFGLFDFSSLSVTPKDNPADGRPTQSDLDNVLADTSSGITNFSSKIVFAFSDPTRLAAGLDIDVATQNSVTGAQGDGRNMTNFLGLKNREVDFTSGTFALNDSTFSDSFSEMVTYVGNTTSAYALNAKVSGDSFTAAASRRDEVSAVSLDEEFTRLIQYQKAFQASARMVKIADDLLSQIVGLI